MAATCSRFLSQSEHTPKLEIRKPKSEPDCRSSRPRPAPERTSEEGVRSQEYGVRKMGTLHFHFLDPMFLTEIFVGGLSNTSGFVIRISDFGLRATVCLRDNKLAIAG